jgi:16S rRNA (cytosine967-C5)-methyltransferase
LTPPSQVGRGARDVAARVLARVTRDGAFAAAALDAEIQRASLDPRDARLATELTYGVLRTEGWLVETGEALAAKGKLPDEPIARGHLLIGLYSLAFLDRLPPHAVVSEAVSGVRREVGEGPSKFANALLRSYARSLEAAGSRPSLGEAAARSVPAWLKGALTRSLGEEGATAYLGAGPIPPPVALAVRDPSARDAWIERITAAAPAGATVRAGAVSRHAILLSGAGNPKKLPGFEEDWIVQEEGAQALALALDAAPGSYVLDACAGRGNKTWLLAALAGPQGRVVACDLHPSKLAKLTERIPNASVFAVDWTIGPGDVPEGADRVLVDAPCSGTGTLRRRPDILRRLREEDVAELAGQQIAIARGAASRAKAGARFLYAVCSVLEPECEGVVRALCEPSGQVALAPAPFEGEGVPEALRGQTAARLLPQEHATDGYFLAGFVVQPL